MCRLNASKVILSRLIWNVDSTQVLSENYLNRWQILDGLFSKTKSKAIFSFQHTPSIYHDIYLPGLVNLLISVTYFGLIWPWPLTF